MKTILTLLCLALPLATAPSHAAWIVRSDFQLQLTEKLFDDLIGDFWQSLQGRQVLPVPDFTITPQGIPVQIRGIKAEVNYSFPLPERVPGGGREWSLHSENLSARITVDSISADTVRIIEDNGIIIEVPVHAECHNISLSLPPGQTRVAARVRAEVAQNQVQLSLPHYEAEWSQGAWRVDSIQCTGIDGIDVPIKQAALDALSSFQNFDTEVRTALTENFGKWSREASFVLLSERELPSTKDYLKIFYEPRTAVETTGGLLLGGELRFEYPFVSPDQTIEQHYELEVGRSRTVDAANPQLMIPFAAVRSLMMGEYFSGKLEHSIWSNTIPAFTELMQSRWKQFWAWPELMNYPKDAKFAFQFVPMGPPSFTKERAGANNSISGNLNMPLGIRMYTPLGARMEAMVEFRTFIDGQTNLRLLKGGKIDMQLTTKKHAVTYAWAKKYVAVHHPTERVAAETMADAARESLSKEGFTLELPSITVGKSLNLVPEKWNLEGGNKNLRLDFATKK